MNLRTALPLAFAALLLAAGCGDSEPAPAKQTETPKASVDFEQTKQQAKETVEQVKQQVEEKVEDVKQQAQAVKEEAVDMVALDKEQVV